MAWNEAVITDAGIALLGKTFTEGNIVLTGAAGGEGYTAAEELTRLTDIRPPLHEMGLAGIRTEQGNITVKLRVQNTGLDTRYTLRQIGIFAKEKGAEGEDILFAVIQDETGELIPAVTENPEFLLEFDFVIPVGNAENIEVVISSGLFALQSELDELRKRIGGLADGIQSAPVQSGVLTYNGQAQEPEWSGYDPELLTLSDCGARTDAGVYTALFTPKEGRCWRDGGTDGRTALWTIGKALGSLELSQSEITLSGSAAEAVIEAAVSGDGTVTAVSDDGEVAAVKVNGSTITITALKTGSAAVTVRAAGTNYSYPEDKTVHVSAEIPSHILEENSPRMIQAVVRSGQAANYWKVGDRIPIELNGKAGDLTFDRETYYAVIIGFDHNKDVEGSNTVHFRFGQTEDGTDIAFCDSKYGNTGADAAFRMNRSDSNAGGWASSYMRSTVCSEFLAAMPEEWQEVIAPCPKYTDNKAGTGVHTSEPTSTSDKIWLPATYEVLGSGMGHTSAKEANYQQQYEYYANGNGKSNRRHDDAEKGCYWWLRSPHGVTDSAAFFCGLTGSGDLNPTSASASYGFAPCFSIS